MATNNIQVVLELGHTAFFRPNSATTLTHDWVVFLRGPKDGPGLMSFEDPHRVIFKPPYEIRESGYAGFMMPIDIYLRCKGDDLPTKIRFDYNLELCQEESRNALQIEKITFRNPSSEFRRKLLEGGGSGVLESDLEAVTPGRRWVQTYEHLNPTDHIPKAPTGPQSFEEFARLFGLESNNSSLSTLNSTSTQKPIHRKVMLSEKSSSGVVDNKSNVKIHLSATHGPGFTALADRDSSYRGLELFGNDKVAARGGTAHYESKASVNLKAEIPAIQQTRIATSNEALRTKGKVTASDSSSGKSPNFLKEIMAPSSAASSISSRSVREKSSPPPETILKKMGKSKKMMSPLSPRSPVRVSSSVIDGSDEDDVFATKIINRKGSTGVHLPVIEDKKNSNSSNWYKMDEYGSGMISELEPSDNELSSEKWLSSREQNRSTVYSSKTSLNVLKPDEIIERSKLHTLLGQITDRDEIQRIVDVLGPLGAFEIDRTAGTFSFNLCVLDRSTIERIKKISHYDDYDFEEA